MNININFGWRIAPNGQYNRYIRNFVNSILFQLILVTGTGKMFRSFGCQKVYESSFQISCEKYIKVHFKWVEKTTFFYEVLIAAEEFSGENHVSMLIEIYIVFLMRKGWQSSVYFARNNNVQKNEDSGDCLLCPRLLWVRTVRTNLWTKVNFRDRCGGIPFSAVQSSANHYEATTLSTWPIGAL